LAFGNQQAIHPFFYAGEAGDGVDGVVI